MVMTWWCLYAQANAVVNDVASLNLNEGDPEKLNDDTDDTTAAGPEKNEGTLTLHFFLSFHH